MTGQYTEQYIEGIRCFQKSFACALDIHAKVRRLPLQGVSPTARLMFARIVFLGASILRLCPKIEEEHSIWDFTSIAILSRSLFESIMFFRYFCAAGTADELVARMMVMHLHDRCERARLFAEMGRPEDVKGFKGEAEELRQLLQKNGYFHKLDERAQKSLLEGYRPALITLREMGEKYAPSGDTWVFYLFLSSYTHAHPMGFMRNSEDRRDGLPNDTDKMYIPGVLSWLAALLDGAIAAFQKVPAGV